MAGKRTVLVTGASGYIAAQLLPAFREAYDLRLVDVKAGDGVTVADLRDPDRTRYRPLFEGADTVVHLGYQSPGRRDAWGGTDQAELDRVEGELANVRMAQNVYRTALEAGVRRVVMASSNHAADWYEHHLVHAGKREMVFPSDLPLSDNFYGWAKACYELLGFVYASGAFGRKLEVVQVRIGAPRDVSGRQYEGALREQHVGPGASGLANFKRDLGAWVSERDLHQLFRRAVDTPDVFGMCRPPGGRVDDPSGEPGADGEDRHGVPWVVVYGISGNTRAFWSLETARRVLGYAPEDDSEVRYGDDVRRLLTGPDAGAPGGRLGA